MWTKKKLYSVEYTPSRGKYEGQKIDLFYYNAELFSWLKDTAEIKDNSIVKFSNLTNFWRNEDIPKADIANEGGVKFPRGKKPEQLLKRILEISTNPGDLVLDSFGGSGTTAATAHKMGRKWVLVELGDQCNTHIIPRLKKVIDGEDQTGISKAVNWQGGGGFRYYKLAPSLLEQDRWGRWVISKDYDAAMLAEAICKLEGFTYAPSDTEWWNHGYSTEQDRIYVTTQTLSVEQLEVLSDEVGEDRTLLVCCSAFRCKVDCFPNLTLKKIPKMVLSRCEWGHDDYSLNVENLPMKEKPKEAPQSNQRQADLFDVEGNQD
ncbi:DNA methyltransferase [Photorhabdus temperata]|uniref:DNA methyltransferase n=1 Tax=Photorhabdus temperata TaxID=574560 RepID=UPI000FFB32B4